MPIQNPEQDPYLHFAESERRQGKGLFSPWTTSDKALLDIAANYFPQVLLPDVATLRKPDTSPVEIQALENHSALLDPQQKPLFVAVGGPPAALVALQWARLGRPVLYLSDQDLNPAGKIARPIWAGAANHGEPDTFTEGPAYLAGQMPFRFLRQEWRRLFQRCRYEVEVLAADYPWLSLNKGDWLRNPGQWLAALRVTWGFHRFGKAYWAALKTGKTTPFIEDTRRRVKDSAAYLHQLEKELGGILRPTEGSLALASSAEAEKALLCLAEALKEEGLALNPLTPEQAQNKYGFTPRQTLSLFEKSHDFIFCADFLSRITDEIQRLEGQVLTSHRLTRLFADSEKNQGGLLEFYSLNDQGKKVFHYQAFTKAHLSLGPTLFRPNLYDLISVTGVSINALLIGPPLRDGPITFGGSARLIPLFPPQKLSFPDPVSGELTLQDLSFVRLSTGASIGPADRGKNWYHYDGRDAVNLLHRAREMLPKEMQLKVLSVIGCNRMIGADGRQIELHPTLKLNKKKVTLNSVTIQIGAGGGGLTQMGAVAKNLV